jgi:ABC-type nitrate/sulfonate/bicarbonate transport system permease component
MPSGDLALGAAAAPPPDVSRKATVAAAAPPAWWDRPAVFGGVTFVVLFALWECAARMEWVEPYLLPSPSVLVQSLYDMATRGFPDGIIVTTHILVTLRRVLLGFALAVAAAIPVGIVIGSVPVLERLSRGLIAFGRSVAAISLLPLFIAWFGIGETSKVMLIALGAFWVVVTYTIAGVKFVDPLLIRAARSMDTPAPVLFATVILPAALPRIFTGIRVGLGVAFMVIVAAEMIATVEGLGALIKEGRNAFRTDVTMVGMLLIGLMGSIAVRALGMLERRIAPWAVEDART